MLLLLLLLFVLTPSSSGPIRQCALHAVRLPMLPILSKKSVYGDLNPIPLGRLANVLPTALIRFFFDVTLVVVVIFSRPDSKSVDAVSSFTKLSQ